MKIVAAVLLLSLALSVPALAEETCTTEAYIVSQAEAAEWQVADRDEGNLAQGFHDVLTEVTKFPRVEVDSVIVLTKEGDPRAFAIWFKDGCYAADISGPIQSVLMLLRKARGEGT